MLILGILSNDEYKEDVDKEDNDKDNDDKEITLKKMIEEEKEKLVRVNSCVRVQGTRFELTIP